MLQSVANSLSWAAQSIAEAQFRHEPCKGSLLTLLIGEGPDAVELTVLCPEGEIDSLKAKLPGLLVDVDTKVLYSLVEGAPQYASILKEC